MKHLIPLALATLLSAPAALAMGGAPQDKASNVAYIDSRIEEELLKHPAPLVKDKIAGTWKRVLIGPNGSKIGTYDSAGIPNSNGTIPLIRITNSKVDWLPGEVGSHFVVSFPEGLNTLENYIMIKKDQPMALQLVGDRFGVKLEGSSWKDTKSFMCAFVDQNYNRIICKQNEYVFSPEVGTPDYVEKIRTLGYERVEEKK